MKVLMMENNENLDKNRVKRLIQLVSQMQLKQAPNLIALYKEEYPKDIDEGGYYYCTYSDDDEKYNEKIARWSDFTSKAFQMFHTELEDLLQYLDSFVENQDSRVL